MSVDFQQKILRVLEYGAFERVQGTETIRVDVRVVTATNADLEDMIRRGLFRADLYDRLVFRVITVPPLRQRLEDIPALVEHFTCAIHKEIPSLAPRQWSQQAVERLSQYHWPGNVRELRNFVERIVCSPGSQVIQPQEIDKAGLGRSASGGSFDEQVTSLQRTMIAEALEASGGNQRKAAHRLGLRYDQFRHHYRKHRYSIC